MNPDWVRTNGLTASASTETNCDFEPRPLEALHFLGAGEKRDSMSVSDAREPDSMSTSVGLTGSNTVDGTLWNTALRQQFGLAFIFTLLGPELQTSRWTLFHWLVPLLLHADAHHHPWSPPLGKLQKCGIIVH